jgi:putative spermidine/putrescine transport system ATP-binding protein
MDEPLGALDKKLREVLQLEIKRIHRELGSTFVYVTHDQEEALVLSDRIAVFNKGRIEQVGTGQALYTAPQTLFVGQFIGESSVLRGAHHAASGDTVLKVAGTNLLAPGPAKGSGAQVILLRPEALVVQAPGTGPQGARTNTLSGRVREMLYLGSAMKYEVTLADGSHVTARTPTQSAFPIGSTVELAWNPKDSALLADDGSTAAL